MSYVTPLLPTKLYIPPPRPDLVARSCLLDRLDAGLRRPLTVIAAPAGFGKTTLVTSWLYAADRPVASRAVAWLSLDADDNDPARWMVHLIAALRQIDGGVGRGARALLGGPQVPDTTAMMTALMGDLAKVQTPFLLILDDYHVIDNGAIHDAVALLLHHPPPSMHLVLVSRETPPLPLPRLRARHQILELGARDLRFAPEEARAFLSRTMDLDLDDRQLEALTTRTEGWIAGLQLTALALRRGVGNGLDGHPQVEEHYVTDYLVTEVLAGQPASVRSFLRRTSVLERLTGPLCDALTGDEDGRERLVALSEANLFVIPLDDRHTWYRYHSLFARALRATLERDELAALHRAAMRWYESAGWMEQAVHHALAYMAITGDTLDAERLVRIASEAMVQQGQVLTVSRWLDALGDDCVQADGELATYRGWVLAITGDLAGAAAVASIAASHYRHGARSGELRDRAPREKLGKLRALGSFIALLREEDNAAAVALAREALTLLPETTVSWRILALWSQAEGLERMNRVAETVETLQEARRIAHTMHETLFAIMVEVSLAKLLNDQGRRRDAVAVCRAALERYTDEAGHPLPLAGFLLAHLGMLHYEANHLEKARHCHQQAADLGERLGLTLEAVYVRGLAAPTLYATGETGAALAALREGYRHAQETGYADPTWFAAWEVNVRLWEGDLVFARHWAERAGLSPQERPQLLTLEQHLTYARVLLAQQRIDEARHWLARLSEFTRTHGLYRWLISTEVLLALAADRLGDRGTAHDFLIRALTAAAPEDYVRPFLTEGPRVIALVQDLRGVNPAFVDHLLAQASGAEAPPGSPPTMVASPVEPLTDREREVMALIAAGLSNREIAEDLVIAVGTVKRHINHIYDKLQVHRRTEAVARARDLGIL